MACVTFQRPTQKGKIVLMKKISACSLMRFFFLTTGGLETIGKPHVGPLLVHRCKWF